LNLIIKKFKIFSNKIQGNQYNIYFKNFIAEAQGLNQNTTLEILPLAQSWNNGTGYYLDNPQEQDGASWNLLILAVQELEYLLESYINASGQIFLY
jgi:hypothetical protein